MPAGQEGITLPPTQEEVLQGFHTLQGSRKVISRGTTWTHQLPTLHSLPSHLGHEDVKGDKAQHELK